MKPFYLVVLILCLIANAAHAQLSFTKPDTVAYYGAGQTGTYLVGNVFTVDYDADGYDDVVFLRGKHIFLRLNNQGTIPTTEILLYKANTNIYHLSNFTDLNADSKPDVAIRTENGTEILFSNGLKYVSAHQAPGPLPFGNLQLKDFDKNGKTDLAYTDENGIKIYNNVAEGVNDSQTFFDITTPVRSFEIADLNADTHLDIVYAQPEKIEILLGNANGIFTTSYSEDVNNGISFEVADLNRDGYLDVTYFETNTNVSTLIFNKQTITFQKADVFANGISMMNLFNFKLIDLKDNGTLDIVFNNFSTLTYKENNGSGQFTENKVLSPNYLNPYTFNVLNLNNDGIPDLMFADYNKYSLLSFDVNAAVLTTSMNSYFDDARDIQFEDIDNDSYEDIVVINRSGQVVIRWGNSEGSYTNYSSYEIPFDCFSGVIADINADGHKDVLLSQRSNAISQIIQLTGKGNRQFNAAVQWQAFNYPGKLQIADVEKDGKPDLITHSVFADNITWFEIGSTVPDEYYSTTKKIVTTGEGIMNMHLTDVNNDGYQDILTSNRQSKNVSLLVNNTQGNFTETLISSSGTPEDIHVVSSIDVNDDGYLDLLAAVEVEVHEYELQIFLNSKNVNYVYEKSLAITEMYAPGFIDIMDIDRDGDLDIVVSGFDHSTCNVFLREGIEFQNNGNPFAVTGQASRLFADINGDTRVDIFTAHFSYGDSFIQYNNTVSEPASTETLTTLVSATTNSAVLAFSETTNSGKIVIVTEGTETPQAPVDNQLYSFNAEFGLGSAMGENSFIVHDGNADTLEIVGLQSDTEFTVTVYDYSANLPEGDILNYATASHTFVFHTLNVPPVLSTIPEKLTTGLATLNFDLDIEDPDDNLGELTFIFTSSNSAVIPSGNITATATATKVTLALVPTGLGDATITVVVKDLAANEAKREFEFHSYVVTGSEKESNVTFKVYPNPINEMVRIEHPKKHQGFTVYNSMGALIHKTDIIPDQLDFSQAPTGLYFFKTEEGEVLKAYKK